MSRRIRFLALGLALVALLWIAFPSHRPDVAAAQGGWRGWLGPGGASLGTDPDATAAPDAKPQAAAASSQHDEEDGADGAPAGEEHDRALGTHAEEEEEEEGHGTQTTDAALVLPDDGSQAPLSDVDWSRFAYTQYVTDDAYLCNSVMIFETLHRLGSNASRVMMYPAAMLPDPATETADERNARLLIKARDEYGVDLVPIEVQRRVGNDETWADSYTKLLAFKQTQYDRVLALDSDSVVLQPMDELFLTPLCPVAMPRAYWLLREDPPKRILSSQLILLQPSTVEFQRIIKKTAAAGSDDYDMEIVNDLYLDSATVLPHRPYDMITGEFRNQDHSAYLGSDREEWDPAAVLREVKFLHFSDWPYPKPWLYATASDREQVQPACVEQEQLDCANREIWNSVYDSFKAHRETVCPDENV
ncbi:hypothetical protein S40293_01761 [Stachybotrys chartarum IBT 40293]|nr:hypothetical protein S40293_01761 [Stachybotrys chartarum IBT 40293]